MDTLIDFDKQLLLWFNGSDSLFFDTLIRVLTNAVTWVPLYLSLLYVVLRNNDRVQKVLVVLGAAGLCVLLAGTIDDTIVKPLVARWRPTHDPEIGTLVDVVDGYRGGRYGFFSAHACNTFSIAIFFCWLIRSRLLSIALVVWSLVNCYTRLYLGVHYPGDICVGLCWGAIVGTLVWHLYKRLPLSLRAPMDTASKRYTVTGYTKADADIPVIVLTLTLVYAILRASLGV